MADNVTHLRQPKPCPVCGKPSVQQFHPFCSSRCADVDLNRWLKGNYVIPGKPLSDDPDGSGDLSRDEDEN